jgi:C-terminal processing protease CtpA/Prc
MLLVTPCTALAYTGVGMEVFVGPDKLPQVVEFLGPEGQKRAGPAYTAGVRLMDKVLAVDGEDAAGLGAGAYTRSR